MKYILAFIGILFISMLFFGVGVHQVGAESTQADLSKICDEALKNGNGNVPAFCGDYDNATKTENTVVNTIDKVANAIAYLTGAIAIIMIMYAGYQFITSDGNSDKVSSARQTIFYAAIGLVVIISARLLVSFAIMVLVK